MKRPLKVRLKAFNFINLCSVQKDQPILIDANDVSVNINNSETSLQSAINSNNIVTAEYLSNILLKNTAQTTNGVAVFNDALELPLVSITGAYVSTACTMYKPNILQNGNIVTEDNWESNNVKITFDSNKTQVRQSGANASIYCTQTKLNANHVYYCSANFNNLSGSVTIYFGSSSNSLTFTNSAFKSKIVSFDDAGELVYNDVKIDITNTGRFETNEKCGIRIIDLTELGLASTLTTTQLCDAYFGKQYINNDSVEFDLKECNKVKAYTPVCAIKTASSNNITITYIADTKKYIDNKHI